MEYRKMMLCCFEALIESPKSVMADPEAAQQMVSTILTETVTTAFDLVMKLS